MSFISIIITIFSFIGIVILLTNLIFYGNLSFFKTLEGFTKQLPPKKEKGHPDYNNKLGIGILDVGKVKTEITLKDVKIFLKELEDFNYERIYFKRKKVELYSRNLQRLLNNITDEDFSLKFNISIIHSVLDEERKKPYTINWIRLPLGFLILNNKF